ncbi:MAG: putative toxin-antitoxin system toxin component, PIN family [archaeon]
MRDFETSEYYLLAKINKALESIILVNPREKVFAVVEDPDDNKVLEVAIEANVDFIVSGDKHLLKLKEFRGINILTAKDFLDFYNPQKISLTGSIFPPKQHF